MHVERGQWHRIPLGDDEVNFETDEVLPRLSTLFRIKNQAVRVILLEIGIVKSYGNGCTLDRNGVDSFKNHNLFDNKHL